MHQGLKALQQLCRPVLRWIDAGAVAAAATVAAAPASASASASAGEHIEWVRILPFVLLHLACLAVFWVGVSPVAVAVMLLMYLVRMFAITGFYHRYFSHRAFKTSRGAQWIFAVLGASAAQRGPLWWAAHHRHHHAHSDQVQDLHSPVHRHFVFSHMGWFLTRGNFTPALDRVRDWQRFPELRLLDRFDALAPLLAALAMWGLGHGLQKLAPQLATDAWQMLVWGFVVSTIACFHATYTINSLCHRWGSRRYDTGDHSRNNPLLALLTLGEGWHNNHHHYPLSARQGFEWWQLDITYGVLWLLSKTGLIWDLKPVPAAVRMATRRLRPPVRR